MSALTFLFWNLQKKNLALEVFDLVSQEGVDILMLAESGITPATLVPLLNSNPGPAFDWAKSNCDRVQIFTRFAPDFMPVLTESGRFHNPTDDASW